MTRQTAVLAYSGGLDTTVAVAWLQESKGLDVIAVAVDVGQMGDMEAVRDRALKTGARESFVIDAVDEFCSDFVLPALQTNALYQQKYPLVSALSRPLICRHLAKIAEETGGDYLAHGCTGKGNDQVRFEVSLAALAPEIQVLAPVREWGMTRDQAIDFALERGLPITAEPASPYSIDENIWGRTVECGALEDPTVEPPDEIWERTVDPLDAPREPRYLEIDFQEGIPVAIDGKDASPAKVIRSVEEAAGAYGIGRVDMIEDRVVGIKSREIYEVPAALTLIRAHSDLEELTLDREVLRTKRILEQRYAQLVYEGYWYSPLRDAIDAFTQSTAQSVTGSVRIRLEPGNARVVGRRSPSSLYDTALATYDQRDAFDHRAAEGFVKLWGLPLRIWGRSKRHDR